MTRTLALGIAAATAGGMLAAAPPGLAEPEDTSGSLSATIIFPAGAASLTDDARADLAALLAAIPMAADANVRVSPAVPRGRTPARVEALATRRAEVTAKALRRMPDPDSRISRVRVAPARTVARAALVDRVRIVASWTSSATRPSAPTDVSASAALRSISVAWQRPERPGMGGALTYTAYAVAGRERPGGWAPSARTPSCTVVDALGCTVSGLSADSPYTVAVVAANAVGESDPSPWPHGPVVPFGPTSSNSSSGGGGNGLARPGPPGTPTVRAADREAEVTWTAPTSGGGAITGYRVSVATSSSGPFTDAAGTCSPVTTTASTALSCTAGGLINGVAHYFRVAAVNAAGTGDASASSAAVTPRGVPGQPGAPSATAGDTASVLTWTAPSDGGSAITGYSVQRSLFGGAFTSQPGCTGASASTAVTCTATGLVNGTSARFRIAAINAAGQSPWSDPSTSITPYGVPGTPDRPEVIAGVTSVVVWWNPPSSNGSEITSYTVSQKAGAGSYADVTGACGESASYPGTTACTLTGLTAGTEYFYKVKATNARGPGSDSAASIGVTPTSSSTAPVISLVDAGNTQLTVDYTVTASGAETVWSRYSSDDGGTWSSWANSGGTSGSLSITGLTNGTRYEVQLGLGTADPPTYIGGTASGRPRTTPGAPASVTGTANDGHVALSWTAPVSDGGAPVLGYLIDVGTSGTGPWTAADGTCAPSRTSSTDSTTCNATGLTNGTAYYFRVAATNDAGTGSTLVSSAVTPAGPPDTPDAPSANGGVSSITVTWTAPATNGSVITGYRVQRSTSDLGPYAAISNGTCTAATVNASATTSCVDNDTALSASSTYYYRVAAISAAGDSLYSDRSGGATLISDPTAPDITSITPSDRSLSIAFTHSGSPTNVSYSLDGGTTWSVRSPASITSPLVLTGLTNGTTYAVRIRMVLASGFSNESDVVPGTPRTTPSAPAAPTGTAGNTSVSLAWSAPADDGGASITGYTVQKSTDGTSYTDQAGCTGLGVDLSCTATGLTSGTAYTFKVAAINAAGTGTYSAASSAITPVAATCAAGGTCRVGDTGPGGGTVFYVATSPQSWGTYLETAPSNWNGGAEPRQAWAAATTTAAAYTGGGLSGWRLGSKDELQSLSRSGQGGPFESPGYWSSTQASSNAFVVTMSNGAATQWAQSTRRYVRPIRAFGPTS